MDFDRILSEASGAEDRAAARVAALAAAERDLREEAHRLCRDAAIALTKANIPTIDARTDHSRLGSSRSPSATRKVWELSMYGTSRALTSDGQLSDLHPTAPRDSTPPRRRNWLRAEVPAAAATDGPELCVCKPAALVMCPQGAWWFHTDNPAYHPVHLCAPSWDSDTGEPDHGTYFTEWLENAVRRLGSMS